MPFSYCLIVSRQYHYRYSSILCCFRSLLQILQFDDQFNGKPTTVNERLLLCPCYRCQVKKPRVHYLAQYHQLRSLLITKQHILVSSGCHSNNQANKCPHFKSFVFSSTSDTVHLRPCSPRRCQSQDFFLFLILQPGLKLMSVQLHLF